MRTTNKLKSGHTIKFTITAIKNDGLRHLAFDNNKYGTYETQQEAETRLRDIFKANSLERITELIGEDLQVTPVECYAGGDAIRTVF